MENKNEELSLQRPDNNNKVDQDVNQEESGITLGDIWRMIKKHWVAIVICLFIGLAGGAVYAKAIKKPKYTSSGTIMVIHEDAELSEDRNMAGIVYGYITTGTVKEAVANKMIEKGYGSTYNAKDGTIDTSALSYSATMPTYGSTTNTSLYITVSATTSVSKMSKDLVDTVMEVTKSLCDGGDSLMSSVAKGYVNISSTASEPKDTSTSGVIITLIGTLIGVVVGAAYAIIRELTNVHVSSKMELETLTGYKVIGMIPKYEKDDETNADKKGENKDAK